MSRKKIIELSCDDAKDFFLKQDSYCNFNIPKYFSFEPLLKKLSCIADIKSGINIETAKTNNINHTIFTHKNGKLSWRPLTLINPVMYVWLLNIITETNSWQELQNRFKLFKKCKSIICVSLPVLSTEKQKQKAEQVSEWWEKLEQESIRLSLQFRYVAHADIADCYPSIYTHSIAWAIMGKKNAKRKKDDKKELGNKIDKIMQYIHLEQTNGIMQGSILMDFIAEIVLGYIDRCLEIKIKKEKIVNYKILRYRDDYRIFIDNKDDGEKILKCLAEVLFGFGLKINASKTKITDDIIGSSIKEEKIKLLEILGNELNFNNLQKLLILLRKHCIEYPNGNALSKYLSEIHKKLDEEYFKDFKNIDNENLTVLISIISDIAYNNPKLIPLCFGSISILFEKYSNDNIREKVVKDIVKKMTTDFDSGMFQIWLNRIVSKYPNINTIKFTEEMCKLSLQNNELFDYDFVNSKKIKNIIKRNPIFNQNEFNKLNNIIKTEEVGLFNSQYY